MVWFNSLPDFRYITLLPTLLFITMFSWLHNLSLFSSSSLQQITLSSFLSLLHFSHPLLLDPILVTLSWDFFQLISWILNYFCFSVTLLKLPNVISLSTILSLWLTCQNPHVLQDLTLQSDFLEIRDLPPYEMTLKLFCDCTSLLPRFSYTCNIPLLPPSQLQFSPDFHIQLWPHQQQCHCHCCHQHHHHHHHPSACQTLKTFWPKEYTLGDPRQSANHFLPLYKKLRTENGRKHLETLISI